MAKLSPVRAAESSPLLLPRIAVNVLRALWVVLALLIIGLIAAGTVMRYWDHRAVCTAPMIVCFMGQRLAPANLATIADPEAALRFHAAFFAVVNTIRRRSWSTPTQARMLL